MVQYTVVQYLSYGDMGRVHKSQRLVGQPTRDSLLEPCVIYRGSAERRSRRYNTHIKLLGASHNQLVPSSGARIILQVKIFS